MKLRSFPTNEEFKELILNNFELKKNDPVEGRMREISRISGDKANWIRRLWVDIFMSC